MSARLFTRQETMEGGRLVSTYRISCSRCGVGVKINGRIPPQVIAKKFQERLWHVGRTEAEDLCPEHRKREPAIVRDPQKSVVDRVLSTMKAFEDALTAYSLIEAPLTENLLSEIEAFHTRVFGD